VFFVDVVKKNKVKFNQEMELEVFKSKNFIKETSPNGNGKKESSKEKSSKKSCKEESSSKKEEIEKNFSLFKF